MAKMLDFREYGRLRRILYSKPSIIFLFFIIIWMGVATYHMYEKRNEAETKGERSSLELAAMKERLGTLEANIERLSTPHGIEKEIRDRYMVAKEGETMLIIADDPNSKETHEVVVSDTPKTSFFGKMSSLLLDGSRR